MYVTPILIIAAVCLIGVAWSPVVALIVAGPALVAFFAFVGFSPRADEARGGGRGQPAGHDRKRDAEGGVWASGGPEASSLLHGPARSGFGYRGQRVGDLRRREGRRGWREGCSGAAGAVAATTTGPR